MLQMSGRFNRSEYEKYIKAEAVIQIYFSLKNGFTYPIQLFKTK